MRSLWVHVWAWTVATPTKRGSHKGWGRPYTFTKQIDTLNNVELCKPSRCCSGTFHAFYCNTTTYTVNYTNKVKCFIRVVQTGDFLSLDCGEWRQWTLLGSAQVTPLTELVLLTAYVIKVISLDDLTLVFGFVSLTNTCWIHTAGRRPLKQYRLKIHWWSCWTQRILQAV